MRVKKRKKMTEEKHLFVEDDVMAQKYEKKKKQAYLAKQRAYERHKNKVKSSVDYRKREFLNEIRISNRSGSHVNCLRLFKNNTIAHEQTKFMVCWTLLKWGHEFVTEPIFNNGKRADVLDLHTGVVYEVIKSETEEKLADKTEAYPELFEIRKVNANEPFNEELLL
jgi:hypothetical protein